MRFCISNEWRCPLIHHGRPSRPRLHQNLPNWSQAHVQLTHINPPLTFRVILLTNGQTNKKHRREQNLAEVMKLIIGDGSLDRWIAGSLRQKYHVFRFGEGSAFCIASPNLPLRHAAITRKCLNHFIAVFWWPAYYPNSRNIKVGRRWLKEES